MRQIHLNPSLILRDGVIFHKSWGSNNEYPGKWLVLYKGSYYTIDATGPHGTSLIVYEGADGTQIDKAKEKKTI